MCSLFLVAMALVMVIGLTVSVVRAETLPNISVGTFNIVSHDDQCFVILEFAVQNPELIEATIIVHIYVDGEFDHYTNIGRNEVSPTEILLVRGCPETSLEVVLDPDNLIVETDETDNQVYLFLDLVPVTPNPTISPTAVSTMTVTPTETEVPVVCLSLWEVVEDEVIIRWDCNKIANLYLDGEFVRSEAGGVVRVNKSDFVVDMELAIDPDGQNSKVYLTWEELFGSIEPAPTSTPSPSPTATLVVFPTPSVTPPPTSCSTPHPTNFLWTMDGNNLQLNFGCKVESVNVYVDGKFWKNFQDVDLVVVEYEFETIELVFDPDRSPLRMYFQKFFFSPYKIHLAFVAR